MTRELPGCGGPGYWQQRADVVVIGTGVAGLVSALAAHRRGRKVVVGHSLYKRLTALAVRGAFLFPAGHRF